MENSYYAQFHTSAELMTMFTHVFGGRLGFCGFEAIGPRKWVQETGRGFKFLFHLHPQSSGAAYLPCGAISLDFVPRLKAGRFKLQPKPKNVAIHYSFNMGLKPRWSWMIDKNREGFREKVEAIAGESVTEITTWFQKFRSVEDVVAALDQEKAAEKNRSLGFYSYPDVVLAYSFGLARTRRIADARAEFRHILDSKFYDPDALPQLCQMFEAEAFRTNS